MTTVSCQEQTVTVLESDGREGQTGEPKARSSHLAELLGWLVAMVMTPDPQSVLFKSLPGESPPSSISPCSSLWVESCPGFLVIFFSQHPF